MPTWLQYVVRCPVSVTSVSNVTGEDELSSQLHDLFLAAGGNITTTHSDVFPFASTTLLYGALALEALIFSIAISFWFNGVRFFAAPSDPEKKSLVERQRTSATDNRLWIAFFCAQFLRFSISASALQIHQVDWNHEWSSLIVFVEQLFLGCSCIILTLALNFQRIHRTQDVKRTALNTVLKKQSEKINKITAGIFVVSIVADFVSSRVLSNESSSVADILFWFYFATLVLIAVPACFATIWVVFHKAEVEPTKFAKSIIFVAFSIHFFVMLPPTFYNDKLLYTYTHSTPCPLRDLSFYDIVLFVAIFELAFIFIFVVVEHHRNRLIEISENYAKCTQILTSGAFERMMARSSEGRSMSRVEEGGIN